MKVLIVDVAQSQSDGWHDASRVVIGVFNNDEDLDKAKVAADFFYSAHVYRFKVINCKLNESVELPTWSRLQLWSRQC